MPKRGLIELTTKVIGSPFVPKGWSAFRDANGRTVCVVTVSPVYRVLYGDPLNESICAAVVNVGVLARYAQQQMWLQQLEKCETANTLAS